MNYSETYFELDSEEATHYHLSDVCKGQVETVNTKDQSNAIVYGIFVDTVNMKIKVCNALNAMFVETVDTLVFVVLTHDLMQSTMRCENSTLYKVVSCPCQEGRLFVTVQHLKSLPSCGLSCSPVSPRRQLC